MSNNCSQLTPFGNRGDAALYSPPARASRVRDHPCLTTPAVQIQTIVTIWISPKRLIKRRPSRDFLGDLGKRCLPYKARPSWGLKTGSDHMHHARVSLFLAVRRYF